MIHSFWMLLMPENVSGHLAVQATPQKPPAKLLPARGATTDRAHSLKFVASVAGNAFGFAGIMATCWLSLQLLQSLL